MKRRHLFFVFGFMLGFTAAGIIGSIARERVAHNAARDVLKWRTQWEGTRDAWLEDRRAWRDGKPFEYNYGPHHSRW